MFYVVKKPLTVYRKIDRLSNKLNGRWVASSLIMRRLNTDRSYALIPKLEYDAFLLDLALVALELREGLPSRIAIEKFLAAEYGRSVSPSDTKIENGENLKMWEIKVPNGRDRFSSLKHEDLLFELGDRANGQPPEVCRWMLRGLPEAIAIKRTEWALQQSLKATGRLL